MRLLLDLMCGGPVSYLRMCNHDAAYAADRGLEADDALLRVAREEDRTLVTRDVALAARADDAVLLESRSVEEQLRELAAAGVDLTLADDPERCGRCNGRLEAVDPTTRTPEYAPDPGETTVRRCLACGQHFWKGSHWDRVRERLAGLETANRAADEGESEASRPSDDEEESGDGRRGGEDRKRGTGDQ